MFSRSVPLKTSTRQARREIVGLIREAVALMRTERTQTGRYFRGTRKLWAARIIADRHGLDEFYHWVRRRSGVA